MEIFWMDYREGSRQYDPAEHSGQATLFLYWRECLGGEVLLAAGSDRIRSHKQLREFAVFCKLVAESDFPVGAGSAKGGRIEKWKSDGFLVVTPDSLHPAIKEALGLSD